MHCTATPQHWNAERIKAVFKARGWRNPGYHYLICPDGDVIQLLSEQQVANGVRGYNSTSIHVAYIGGIDNCGKPVDNRTAAQKKTLALIIGRLKQCYPLAKVLGHRDISTDKNHNGTIDPWERIKECPCFNAIDEYGKAD